MTKAKQKFKKGEIVKVFLIDFHEWGIGVITRINPQDVNIHAVGHHEIGYDDWFPYEQVRKYKPKTKITKVKIGKEWIEVYNGQKKLFIDESNYTFEQVKNLYKAMKPCQTN